MSIRFFYKEGGISSRRLRRIGVLCVGFLLFFFLVTPAPANAKPMRVLAGDMSHTIGLEVDSDGMLGVGAYYGYRFPSTLRGNDLLVYGRIGTPLMRDIAAGEMHALKVNVGIATHLPLRGYLAMVAGIDLAWTYHKETLGRFNSIGIEGYLHPGFQIGRGFFGLRIDYLQNILTHIKHSGVVYDAWEDRYPDSVTTPEYTAPVSGFYSNTGSVIRFSLAGYAALGERFTLTASAGYVHYMQPYAGPFDAMMIGVFPFRVSLGFDVGLY
jgi:hypothetical protein